MTGMELNGMGYTNWDFLMRTWNEGLWRGFLSSLKDRGSKRFHRGFGIIPYRAEKEGGGKEGEREREREREH